MERFKLLGAVHLFLVRDQEILLLRRLNTGYEDGSYSVPAGHLEGGESVIAGAIREAKEECGIEIPSDDIEVVGVMHRRSDTERIDFFLRPNTWHGEIRNMEPHKCDELSWYAWKALPANMIPYVKKAWSNYRNGIWFAQFGWE